MANDIHDLVQHVQWRCHNKTLTEDQFMWMANDYGDYSRRELEGAWAMFSLGQLPYEIICPSGRAV